MTENESPTRPLHSSELARLRQQIALEYEAAERALHSPTITAPHAFITQRMERVWEHLQAAERVVGKEGMKQVLADLFAAPPAATTRGTNERSDLR